MVKKALKYIELSISSEGELLVKGKTLFKSYIKTILNDKSKLVNFTNNQTDKNGWYKTGDMGEIDKNGNLFIKGRKDNMFISGGENIYPEEIESAILKINSINKVVVLPFDHKDYGQRPAAFIDPFTNNISLLKEEIKKVLPSFKIPDHFLPWPDDIDEQNLKIDREKFKKYLT